MTEHTYRGYVFSRPISGEVIPQRVQNLVIRDYAKQRDLSCLLSATEYAMRNCIIILKGVLEELGSLRGIIFYSLWQLPEDTNLRCTLYDLILKGGNELHFALERLVLRDTRDLEMIEDLWLARSLSDVSANLEQVLTLSQKES